MVIASGSRSEDVIFGASDSRSDDIGGTRVRRGWPTSLGGPAPASMKRKTLLPARCRRVVPQVQPIARRLFRERKAFLSAEAGETLLLRVQR